MASFQHHRYEDTPPTSHWEIVAASLSPPVGSAEHQAALAAAGQSFRAFGVGAVVLVHGTFVGDDLAGVCTLLDRLGAPGGDSIRRFHGKVVDLVMGETGNYSPEFAERLEAGLNAGLSRGRDADFIRVERFRWSGENHHLARADGAVRLLTRLRQLKLPAGKRILLWGHSHGGNVLSILTHLVSGDGEKILRFFEAATPHYRGLIRGAADQRYWNDARELLLSGQQPLAQNPLDIVTFGTPIRYGWDERGASRLLHFVHHQPLLASDPGRGSWSAGPKGVLQGKGGDYVHALGVAGTNLPPLFVDVRSLVADYRLGRLLEHGVSPQGRIQRLASGRRAPDAGVTLLVDYGEPRDAAIRSLLGHAVYTRSRWLPFHLGQIARRFYENSGPPTSSENPEQEALRAAH